VRVMGENWVQGKVVVITGGAGGIGAALAWKFGREGGRIALIDVDEAEVKNREKELQEAGVTAFAQKGDIASESECALAITEVIRRFGGIDILINNAGISHRGRFRDAEIATIRKVMEVNFFGSVMCTKAALESLLIRRGMVIVISSIAGLTPVLGRTAYCASKHALHGLFETLRGELHDQGVHVMIACPGFTKTNLQNKALNGKGQIATHSRTMVGREVSPAEVADAIFKGAGKRKELLILTPTGKLSHLLFRFAPGFYERLMRRKLAKEIFR
jgi:NAD(P)-dependent dehydrogenase (short-subunit alcohol dehydrogenase family)